MKNCLRQRQVICLEKNKYLIFLKDYTKIMLLFSTHHDCLESFEIKLKKSEIYIEKFKGTK